MRKAQREQANRRTGEQALPQSQVNRGEIKSTVECKHAFTAAHYNYMHFIIIIIIIIIIKALLKL
jgi:hypothetical protein